MSGRVLDRADEPHHTTGVSPSQDDIPVFDESRDGTITAWNRAAARDYGYESHDVIGEPASLLLTPGAFSSWRQVVQRVLAGHPLTDFWTVHVAKDGRQMDVRLDARPIRDEAVTVTGLSVVVREQRIRRRTRDILRDSDGWMRAIVEHAVDGIVVVDEYGIIQYFNPAAEDLFGYAAGEVMGKHFHVLVPSPERGEDAYLLSESSDSGIKYEAVGMHKSGRAFPVRLSASVIRLEGRLVFVGMVHDIARLKEVQEEKDRLLLDLNRRNVEMVCLNRLGDMIRSRGMPCDVVSEVVELLTTAFQYPDSARCRISFDGSTFDGARFEAGPWRLAADILVAGRKRGAVEVFYTKEHPQAEVGPFLESEQNLLKVVAGALGLAVERRESEAQVVQASKLASIGELAAGIGHEINNPLNGIINCADLLMDRLEGGSEEREFAGYIRSESERIASIVRNLLAFSRQEREPYGPAFLQDIVLAVLSLCQAKIAYSFVDLHVDVPDDLPPAKGSSEQIQQVLMNLIINALHALDERLPGEAPGKTLTISARTVERDDGFCLRLAVEDRGCGIDPAIVDRIFDPFFTTKGRDKGTGLGLSVSDGIVKEHGGRITVESEPGNFARFIVDLPLMNGCMDPNGHRAA